MVFFVIVAHDRRIPKVIYPCVPLSRVRFCPEIDQEDAT